MSERPKFAPNVSTAGGGARRGRRGARLQHLVPTSAHGGARSQPRGAHSAASRRGSSGGSAPAPAAQHAPAGAAPTLSRERSERATSATKSGGREPSGAAALSSAEPAPEAAAKLEATALPAALDVPPRGKADAEMSDAARAAQLVRSMQLDSSSSDGMEDDSMPDERGKIQFEVSRTSWLPPVSLPLPDVDDVDATADVKRAQAECRAAPRHLFPTGSVAAELLNSSELNFLQLPRKLPLQLTPQAATSTGAALVKTEPRDMAAEPSVTPPSARGSVGGVESIEGGAASWALRAMGSDLREMRGGRVSVGKLRAYRSGRVKLSFFDGVEMDVQEGVPCRFAQHLFEMDHHVGDAVEVGPVRKRFVAVPDVDSILLRAQASETNEQHHESSSR